jgi:hypothetical protein
MSMLGLVWFHRQSRNMLHCVSAAPCTRCYLTKTAHSHGLRLHDATIQACLTACEPSMALASAIASRSTARRMSHVPWPLCACATHPCTRDFACTIFLIDDTSTPTPLPSPPPPLHSTPTPLSRSRSPVSQRSSCTVQFWLSASPIFFIACCPFLLQNADGSPLVLVPGLARLGSVICHGLLPVTPNHLPQASPNTEAPQPAGRRNHPRGERRQFHRA